MSKPGKPPEQTSIFDKVNRDDFMKYMEDMIKDKYNGRFDNMFKNKYDDVQIPHVVHMEFDKFHDSWSLGYSDGQRLTFDSNFYEFGMGFGRQPKLGDKLPTEFDTKRRREKPQERFGYRDAFTFDTPNDSPPPVGFGELSLHPSGASLYRFWIEPADFGADGGIDLWVNSPFSKLLSLDTFCEAFLQSVGGDLQLTTRSVGVKVLDHLEHTSVLLKIFLEEPSLVRPVDEHLAADFIKGLNLSLRGIPVPPLAVLQGLEPESLGYQFCDVARAVTIVFDVLIVPPIAFSTFSPHSSGSNSVLQRSGQRTFPTLKIGHLEVGRRHGFDNIQWYSESSASHVFGGFGKSRVPVAPGVQKLRGAPWNDSLQRDRLAHVDIWNPSRTSHSSYRWDTKTVATDSMEEKIRGDW